VTMFSPLGMGQYAPGSSSCAPANTGNDTRTNAAILAQAGLRWVSGMSEIDDLEGTGLLDAAIYLVIAFANPCLWSSFTDSFTRSCTKTCSVFGFFVSLTAAHIS
jgi:hypothetical protein